MKQQIATESVLRSAGRHLGMACSALLFLTACTPSAPPPNPPPLTAAQAAARTVVPLTRPIELVAMAQPLVLDIEVPPPGPNASASLSLGLRLIEPDSARLETLEDVVNRANLPAKISLTNSADNAEVPLFRRAEGGHGPQEPIQVGAEGYVPGVYTSSVDSTLLDQTGLVQEGRGHRVLEFAWTAQVMPGHYRFKFQLLDPPSDVSAMQAELMVAYSHKAK